MKILFLSDNFPPEVNAPATRTYEHCREWVRLGAEVTVITCAPNFPRGKVFPGYRNSLCRRETVDGINVIRVWSYITANEGFLRRTLDYLSFAGSAFLAGLFRQTDIIVATSPQFFTTFAGCALARFKGKPWVFELRDFWPESIRTVGAMKDSFLLRWLARIEMYLYRDAALVVAVTEAFKEKLVARGIDPRKIRVVTNGANLGLFVPREKPSELLERLNLRGKFVVSYIGTHGMAHGLEFIVNAIDKIADDAVHFLFIGDGAKKGDVLRLARSKDLANATFLETVGKEQVAEYLALSDAVLVPLVKAETFRSVIPSKIFEAAAMEKPILLGVEGEARRIVETYEAGLCFEPENEADFLAKVRLISSDGEMYERARAGCARLARAFDRSRLAAEMYGYLKDTISLKEKD
jgi:glycosyltransferase involved in cell wall biosynthesis